MNDESGASSPLPQDLATAVVEAIQDAYYQNAPLQDRSLGHDDWTYALTNFKTIKHFLRDRLDKALVVEEGNSLRLEHDGNVFFIHKVGRSEQDDAWASFPNHPGPAGHAAQLQLSFDVETSVPRIWVIAHYGNLDDGLCAVRLQASGAAEAGKIRSWMRVVDLWVRPDEAVLAAEAAAATPPVEVPEPAVEIKGVAERQRATEQS